MKRFFLLFVVCAAAVLSATSCITLPAGMALHARREDPAGREARERGEIVRYAEGLLGLRNITALSSDFRNDCSGLVLGVYQSLGYRIELEPGYSSSSLSKALFMSLRGKGLIYRNRRPRPADVVFFAGTSGRRTGAISHVGLVSDILDDGTIRILNYTSRGVTELRMNLEMPHLHKDFRGNIINDYLRQGISLSAPGPAERKLSAEWSLVRGQAVEGPSAIEQSAKGPQVKRPQAIRPAVDGDLQSGFLSSIRSGFLSGELFLSYGDLLAYCKLSGSSRPSRLSAKNGSS